MSGRLALRQRAELLAQLRDIVRAMKNLAFAQLQRIGRERPALAQAREALTRALQDLGDEEDAAPVGRPASWLVIGAERGFCGAFNAQLAEVVADLRAADPAVRVLVAGGRLAEAVPQAQVLAGCPALEDLAPVLAAWLAPLQAEVAAGRALCLLHHGPGGLVRRCISPSLEGAREVGGQFPLHHLPLPVLRATLRWQALRLQLHEALVTSLEQEHHARLTQMQRAQDHLDELGRQLRRREAVLRQSDITNELEMLALAG